MLPEVEKNDTDEIYPRHLWSKEAKERDNDDERMDAGEFFCQIFINPAVPQQPNFGNHARKNDPK